VSNSNFVDYVKLFCRSGNGGRGAMHLRREKFVPKGGPDGGDGGRGGDIILRGNAQYWTLIHLKYRKHIRAEDGESGGGALSHGADGKDIYLDVPLGTVAKVADSDDIIAEITSDGEEKILVKGGRGGLGNANFKTPTNQTPRYSQPGEPGSENWYILELKILADVDDDKSFVMADIPGIIEGAHEGKGLGIRFLKHIERNSMLLFTIPCDSRDIAGEYKILLKELREYNPELLDKERLLAITKSDLLDGELEKIIKKTLPRQIPHIFISSVTGKGIGELKDLLWKRLNG